MPKSQHPYFVCADHALDPMLEESQENQHIVHIHEHDQVYRWNVMVQTPDAQPWIGLNLIYRILNEMQVVHSTDKSSGNEVRRGLAVGL